MHAKGELYYNDNHALSLISNSMQVEALKNKFGRRLDRSLYHKFNTGPHGSKGHKGTTRKQRIRFKRGWGPRKVCMQQSKGLIEEYFQVPSYRQKLLKRLIAIKIRKPKKSSRKGRWNK